MLYIDADRDKSTGWNGYDFIVNRVNPKNNRVVLEKNYKGKWMWDNVFECEYAVKNNILVITIPRKWLELDGKEIDIEFKWNDNMQEEGNIMDFYVNGDTAPCGRFNYVYSSNP